MEASLPQLCEYLCTSQTVIPTLQVFLNLAKNQPQLLSDYVIKIKKAAECNPNALCIAAQVLSAVGKINKVFLLSLSVVFNFEAINKIMNCIFCLYRLKLKKH